MKTIATILFMFFITVSAKAQTTDGTKIVEDDTMTIVHEIESEEISTEPTVRIARLYKRDNTRVNKALTFLTKANRAKTA